MPSGATGTALLEILVAGRSASAAQQLQHVLAQHGYRVTAAANGLIALGAAQHRKPALIVSELLMPEMDGYELCSRIKQDASLSEIPVILIVSLSDPQEVIRGLECGADSFFLKPYDAQWLLQCMQFALCNSPPHQIRQQGQRQDVVIDGVRHCITAHRLQILKLMLSSYDMAMRRNTELSSTRDALRLANVELQELTLELEERVHMRTQELERSIDVLRNAQQKLIQEERLQAFRQMASGIAHDISNAISPITLYSELLLEAETNLSSRARDQLLSIQRAIGDVAHTVARVRDFHGPREEPLALSELELGPLVQQVVDLTRERWCEQPRRCGLVIDLAVELADDSSCIRGAENELREALSNLIGNAVDAMPRGGRIEVRTDTIAVAGRDGASGRQVQLAVCDNGIGMDEQTRRRCLEPFFTTKGERGAGLGLATVYGMAQRHDAVLDIDSEPGTGTTVRLVFPICTQAPAARRLTATVPARHLRILLVDDDQVILKSLRHALEQDGHSVTVAAGGQLGIEAFGVAKEAGRAFDVVITDMGMLHVDGLAAAAAIRLMAPVVPVILLTGWGQGGDTPRNVDRVLSKPPKIAALRNALADLTNGMGY